ncbi:hypothetical protein BDY21DRAFT_422183 [Lineolata rhizophorae]|uniref:DUF676 domain-containing protein n=1 Tax=Lineolata rhizophorae TaxID=578093 RepID=A0A6A6NXX0_9PEZI|nr:hypothetical protein BDY21DRAFT_422183 [Lineolata rhizophorae]
MPLRLVSQENAHAQIDIVAVPGIGADPADTWIFQDDVSSSRGTGSAADSTEEELDSLTSPAVLVGQHIFAEVRQARVFLYEYPTGELVSSASGGAGRSWARNGAAPAEPGIEYYATDLLSCLVGLPRPAAQPLLPGEQPEPKKRFPLHLVGYSTGGLVAREALCAALASKKEFHLELVAACFSIAFFGVPHYGSTVLADRLYGGYVRETLRQGLNARLRRELSTENAARLERQVLEFSPLALSIRKIWSFVEARDSEVEVPAEKGPDGEKRLVKTLVVDGRSATLSSASSIIGSEEVVTVNSTHADLCRFGDDPNSFAYKEYIAELKRLIEELQCGDHRGLTWLEEALKVDIHSFYEDKKPTTDSMIKVFSVVSPLHDLLKRGPEVCLRKGFEELQNDPMRALSGGSRQSVSGSAVQLGSPRTRPLRVPSIQIRDPSGQPLYADGESEISEQSTESGSDLDKNRISRFGIRRPKFKSEDGDSLYTIHSEPQDNVPIQKKISQLPYLSGQQFRWVHVPCNNMAWVPKVFRTITEESKKPLLSSNLVHPSVWDLKQNVPRHGYSHGRFMQPFCQKIVPLTRAGMQGARDMKDVQLVAYLPYLHWDSFAGLMRRNKIIQKRLKQQLPIPVAPEVMNGNSMETKLIWQYLRDSANLPLHHRRTLDQYGYPLLRNLDARDADQVLFKRTGSIADILPQEEPHVQKAREREYRRRARSRSRLRQAQKQHDAGTEHLSQRDANAKALMVDQLWLWIVDRKTVVTFFPEREEMDPTEFKHADLHNAIHTDVNGDPRLSTQTRNCFEFAALAVKHAVTVFLEQKTDKDLEVFRIFEEYISNLTEDMTVSFKHFRNNHQNPDVTIEEIEEIHDNSADLTNYLELRDVQDELRTIKKLFDEQTKVVREMQRAFEDFSGVRTVDAAHAPVGVKAGSWLKEAEHKIHAYTTQVNHMIENCKTAEDAYTTLLDMKQKKANVVEAALSRKAADRAEQQNRAVLAFTVFTVIFLPLSFFTSLFGMNVTEWTDEPSRLPLSQVLIYMLTFSAAFIGLAFVLAFVTRVRWAIRQVCRYAYYSVHGRWPFDAAAAGKEPAGATKSGPASPAHSVAPSAKTGSSLRTLWMRGLLWKGQEKLGDARGRTREQAAEEGSNGSSESTKSGGSGGSSEKGN